jgi:hypothetical protein
LLALLAGIALGAGLQKSGLLELPGRQTAAPTALEATPGVTVQNEGEESHEPAGVWNRGNVLLGTYGQFHGAPGSPAHPMDLGLLISNDAVYFREPVPDFVFLPRGDPGSWKSGM